MNTETLSVEKWLDITEFPDRALERDARVKDEADVAAPDELVSEK